MARRGEALRSHILQVAKDVFLELGFERASMDEVASRAQTSKRSLYAHFESKEKLFLAIVEHVRELFFGRLRQPGDYGARPAEALVVYCTRYLQTLLYARSIRLSRMCMAQAERFPAAAAQYFDVLFATAQAQLGAYLRVELHLVPETADEAAAELLGRVIYPRYLRALCGLEPPAEDLEAAVDAKPIRRAVTALLASLAQGVSPRP